MLLKRYFGLVKDPLWTKILTLGLILFFILLSDAILSYWVPNFLEDALKSPFAMGLVISFSSIVGFGADMLLPQIIGNTTVKRLLFWGILANIVFSLLLFSATTRAFILTILAAMAVWGVYYELLGFADQQFVSDSVPFRLHATAWGVISIFKSLAYLLGPVIGGILLAKNLTAPLGVSFFLALATMVILFLSRGKHERKIEIEVDKANLIKELEHWKVLFVHVWPVVFLSFFMGLVDATFWTTGAVLNNDLSKINVAGGFFLPLYEIPTLVVGLILAKKKIYIGKKKLAEKLFLLSGVFLILVGLFQNIFLILSAVFVSGIFISIAFPLTNAVYSDVVSRMGRERKHLIGLSSSTLSLAYIFGPALAGYVAGMVGEKLTFSVVGIFVVLVSGILLFTTPKKLKLPQQELEKWSKSPDLV